MDFISLLVTDKLEEIKPRSCAFKYMLSHKKSLKPPVYATVCAIATSLVVEDFLQQKLCYLHVIAC